MPEILKIIIIEDEIPAANRLKKLILDCVPDAQILEILDTVEEAIEWFKNNDEPDVVFSDIQLADGISFEIYEQVEVKCPIIFTTAYDQYAIKSFELNSIDYLLKPFTKEKLEKSFKKLRKIQFNKSENDSLSTLNFNTLLENALNGKDDIYKQRFLISKGDTLIPIATADIAYIFTEDKAVLIKTHDGKNYFLTNSLDDIELQLDPSMFFRLNRQFITSLDAIEKISQYFNGKLKVKLKPTQGGEIIVSRAKTPVFKNWLEH